MRQLATSAVALLLTSAAASADDIVLRGMGSLHVGGRIVELHGRPAREIVRVPGGPSSKLDLNGQYQVEQMYAQYFLPQNPKGKVPLLMWHGGGLTGVTHETTPDGREGWLNMFVRKGWNVYVSDAVERGRSGFASPDVWPGEPIFLPYADPFERFRIGAGDGSWNPDPTKQKLMPGVRRFESDRVMFVKLGEAGPGREYEARHEQARHRKGRPNDLSTSSFHFRPAVRSTLSRRA